MLQDIGKFIANIQNILMETKCIKSGETIMFNRTQSL